MRTEGSRVIGGKLTTSQKVVSDSMGLRGRFQGVRNVWIVKKTQSVRPGMFLSFFFFFFFEPCQVACGILFIVT